MELHILFFILAGILIAILFGFSIWSSRREKSRVFSNTFSTRPPAQPIKQEPVGDIPNTLNMQTQYQDERHATPRNSVENEAYPQQNYLQEEVENAVNAIKINIPAQDAPQPTAPLSQPHYVGQPNVEAAPDFTVQVQTPTPEPEFIQQAAPEMQPEFNVAENGIVTLYIVAAEGQQFLGSYVVQHLESLGFQFGEYQIFHRHQHVDDINSPVMFSVANMVQPGTFDLNRMERFLTVGLVMFMHLPSDIARMKMMISTAEGLAQSLGGFVLNERQEIFDERSRQAYLRCVQ